MLFLQCFTRARELLVFSCCQYLSPVALQTVCVQYGVQKQTVGGESAKS